MTTRDNKVGPLSEELAAQLAPSFVTAVKTASGGVVDYDEADPKVGQHVLVYVARDNGVPVGYHVLRVTSRVPVGDGEYNTRGTNGIVSWRFLGAQAFVILGE